jgi:hypothetical protein
MDRLDINTFIEPTPAMSANYETVVASGIVHSRDGIKGKGFSFTLRNVKGVATFTAEGPNGRLAFQSDSRVIDLLLTQCLEELRKVILRD